MRNKSSIYKIYSIAVFTIAMVLIAITFKTILISNVNLIILIIIFIVYILTIRFKLKVLDKKIFYFDMGIRFILLVLYGKEISSIIPFIIFLSLIFIDSERDCFDVVRFSGEIYLITFTTGLIFEKLYFPFIVYPLDINILFQLSSYVFLLTLFTSVFVILNNIQNKKYNVSYIRYYLTYTLFANFLSQSFFFLSLLFLINKDYRLMLFSMFYTMMFLMFYAYQNYKNNSIRESIDFIENVNNLIDQSKYLENYNELKSFLGKNDIFQKRIRGYYFILNKKNVPLEEYGNCENRRITEEIKDAIIKNDEEKLEKLKNDNIDMLMFNVKPNNELIGVLCLLTDLKNRNEFYMNINRVIENHIYYLTENIELKDKLKNDLSLTVETVLSLIEAKDPINRGHIRRVAYYSYMLGKSLEFSKDELENLRFSSLLYDIGKIEVPDNILKKEGALTDVEYKEIKRHPLIGYNLLKNIDEFKDILTGVLQHHERINGSGYPFGLRGDEISIQAKIIGIIDVFDAITSRRPYRGALSANFALRYLKKNQGRLFDENICSKFIEDIEEGKIKIIRRKDDIFN